LDEVNGQLNKLRTELLKEEDNELRRIAEFGLNAITNDLRVPLQAAMMDVDRAPADGKSKFIAQAEDLVDEFRDHLDSDGQVQACDSNPFGVPVSLRTTLGTALGQMKQALSAAFA